MTLEAKSNILKQCHSWCVSFDYTRIRNATRFSDYLRQVLNGQSCVSASSKKFEGPKPTHSNRRVSHHPCYRLITAFDEHPYRWKVQDIINHIFHSCCAIIWPYLMNKSSMFLLLTGNVDFIWYIMQKKRIYNQLFTASSTIFTKLHLMHHLQEDSTENKEILHLVLVQYDYALVVYKDLCFILIAR